MNGTVVSAVNVGFRTVDFISFCRRPWQLLPQGDRQPLPNRS
ncbi:MAG: hypothetical protein BLITH_0746 [Brockia lithotrophica]|uniref:Uncharacterized protein n=1 Tax=Brockia lithotrophica TaxID=933949 RepID=A0A2T5G8Q6_9BACL|nr:MAG: hypothetical protein BLITH_0746 [Brockia lithotrophica]